MGIIDKASRAADLALLGAELGKKRIFSDSDYSGVIERLGSLHGLPQKIGQILGMRELRTGEGTFSRLSYGSVQLPFDQIRAIVEHELQRPLPSLFQDFASSGIAASLGQVHRATTIDGEVVAVKVQYPHIRDVLETDLAALGWLAKPLTSRHEGFDLNAYRSELRRSILAETDYHRELLALSRFQSHAKELRGLLCPRPYAPLSTSRILTMQWVEGELLETSLEWEAESRRALAEKFIRLFLLGWLQWGEVHADPHPGNVRVCRSTGELVLYDFGCIKEIPREFSDNLRLLLDSADRIAPDEAVALLTSLGFDACLLEPMAQRLPAALQLILEPFLVAGLFDVTTWRLSERLSQCLGDHRWNFRFAGPADLLLFVRAFSGLVQYINLLNVSVNWNALYLECASHTVQHRSETELARKVQPDSLPLKSKEICIQVTEAGKLKAQVTLAVRALPNLKTFIPDEVLTQLEQRQIDISAIIGRALAQECPPGDLFSLVEANKTVRVWLE